jgi:pimeloyl-ACP methyl ester carboxylesterase/class 3 adenylate cyclase
VSQPETRYAQSGDVRIAYQVFGEAQRDLVIVPPFVSHLELAWEHPPYERFMERLASFVRVVVFDKRGSGLSDPVDRQATFEQRMDDIRAVMDAAGCERAALLGMSEGAAMAALFAASHPARTEAIVLYGGTARALPDPPEYTEAISEEVWRAFIEGVREAWGDGVSLLGLAPSQFDNEPFRSWWGRFERHASSPGQAVAALELDKQIDIRDVLPVVRVPSLVVHRTGDSMPIAGARYMAEHIAGARFVELPGDDHWPWIGDCDAVVDEVEEFLTGERHAPEPDRMLATVLFTDIVGSTERAAALGDRAWCDLLERHGRLTRRQLKRYRGREVKSVGDGFLAVFDGPARGIRCAHAIADEVRALGVELRAGLHTGECELIGDDVGGMAVHIGARVAERAAAGEVLVSSTVKDLVVGSGLAFADRGAHALKGAPGEWRLYAAG